MSVLIVKTAPKAIISVVALKYDETKSVPAPSHNSNKLVEAAGDRMVNLSDQAL